MSENKLQEVSDKLDIDSRSLRKDILSKFFSKLGYLLLQIFAFVLSFLLSVGFYHRSTYPFTQTGVNQRTYLFVLFSVLEGGNAAISLSGRDRFNLPQKSRLVFFLANLILPLFIFTYSYMNTDWYAMNTLYGVYSSF